MRLELLFYNEICSGQEQNEEIRIAKAQVMAAQAALTPVDAGVGETDYVIQNK
jgi:hypothetical protein